MNFIKKFIWKYTFLISSLMARSFPVSDPTKRSSCSTVSTAEFLIRKHTLQFARANFCFPPPKIPSKWNKHTPPPKKNHTTTTKKNKPGIMQNNYLAPMDTEMTLSKLSLHHCSTSYAKVALNIALLILWDVQARKIEASWSLNPVLPSSNSLSDSSTTNHSTLRNNKTTCGY